MIQRMLAIWSLLQLLKSNHRPFTNKGAWLCPSKTLLTKQAVSDFANPSLRAAAAAKSLQSCLTLCNPIPGILQARTLALISHASKVMLKFSKPGFSNTWSVNFLMFKLVLEKAEEPEIKLPTSSGSWKKQESSRKTCISASLTMPKPLTMWITINWKILKEMGIPDDLTCLLRNLDTGQEATVRTGHGTTDWFQIGKGVRQGCVLSPCLFNSHAE